MKEPRIICLGNRAACTYRNNPQPPTELTLEELEAWATNVCLLDTTGVPEIGDDVGFKVTAAHRAAMLRELIEKPVLAAVLTGKKLCTTIHVSPQSSLLEALQECTHVWKGDGKRGLPHGEGTPAWIAGNWPALVTLLADHLGIKEIRDLEVEEV